MMAEPSPSRVVAARPCSRSNEDHRFSQYVLLGKILGADRIGRCGPRRRADDGGDRRRDKSGAPEGDPPGRTARSRSRSGREVVGDKRESGRGGATSIAKSSSRSGPEKIAEARLSDRGRQRRAADRPDCRRPPAIMTGAASGIRTRHNFCAPVALPDGVGRLDYCGMSPAGRQSCSAGSAALA